MSDARPKGTGPGAIAPDGSATDFYAASPPDEDGAEIVHHAIPAGASILELGCGTGRMTHPLLGLGHPMVAVDESAEMLAHVRGAPTVRSTIEELDLRRSFDVVLLASHVLEYTDVNRRRLLSACRRHVAPDGRVIFERQHVAWYDTADAHTYTRGEVVYELADVERPARGVVSATMRYRIGESTWSHSFTSQCLDDETLPAMLEAAGLAFDRFLTPDGGWVMARPLP